jgi:DNA-binding NarL/FixJ family response regulator
MNIYKGIVVENSFVLIQGILDWLSKNDNFSSVAATSDWEEAKKLTEENDTVILITTGKWIADTIGIQSFKEYFPMNQVKVLCFIDKSTTNNIVELYNCGIQGLIAMDDSQEEFLWGIKELARGKRHISSDLVSAFMELRVSLKTITSHHVALTKREEEILHFISQGCTNNEIAVKLFISKRTVDGYRESILSKFGARNTAHLMAIKTNGHDFQMA